MIEGVALTVGERAQIVQDAAVSVAALGKAAIAANRKKLRI